MYNFKCYLFVGIYRLDSTGQIRQKKFCRKKICTVSLGLAQMRRKE